MIREATSPIAHFGDPIAPVKAPMIYNPYVERRGVDAVVVPMGVRAEDYPDAVRAVFRFTDIRGAPGTTPHKVRTVSLVQERTTAVRIADSRNAISRHYDESLLANMLDDAGFVRRVERKGLPIAGARCLEFFGFGKTTPKGLRAVAMLS